MIELVQRFLGRRLSSVSQQTTFDAGHVAGAHDRHHPRTADLLTPAQQTGEK